jgi:hypothetical protein
MAPSCRCEAANRSTSWVSVSVMGSSSFGLRRRRAPSPPKPRNRAYSRRGRSQERHVRSTRPQQSRSVCSGNPVLCARKYGFVGRFGRCEQLLVATRSSFSKGAFQNDICRFDSSMPSQPVGSLRLVSVPRAKPATVPCVGIILAGLCSDQLGILGCRSRRLATDRLSLLGTLLFATTR